MHCNLTRRNTRTNSSSLSASNAFIFYSRFKPRFLTTSPVPALLLFLILGFSTPLVDEEISKLLEILLTDLFFPAENGFSAILVFVFVDEEGEAEEVLLKVEDCNTIGIIVVVELEANFEFEVDVEGFGVELVDVEDLSWNSIGGPLFEIA